MKINFLALVSKRFRDFKSKLVSGWITKTRQTSKFENGREPTEIWKHIKIEDWKLFQQLKTSSPAKVINISLDSTTLFCESLYVGLVVCRNICEVVRTSSVICYFRLVICLNIF